MIAECVDPGGTTTLEMGKQYFVFPNGLNHVYVAKRDSKSAHFGCFRKSLFKEVEQRRSLEIEDGVTYKAICATAPGGYAYNNGKTIYFRPTKSKNCGYWYRDPQMKVHGGCYAIEWFTNIEPHEPAGIEKVQKIEVNEQELLPANEWEQLRLF